MVGLMDIAPSTRTVQVEGQPVAVYGVSAQGIAYLLSRFPELQNLMKGGEVSDMTPEKLMVIVPSAIASIIASGCGYSNNEKAEERAASLPADTQLDLLAAIVELTMPKGAGPFVQKLTNAMTLLDATAKVPAIKSQPPLSS